jgi:serine protease Do
MVSANGRPVANPLDWEARILDMRVGEPATLVVRENGRERTLQITPTDLPSLSAERVQALTQFELITLTPAIRAERRVSSERGALIVALPDEARRIGLREGDVIVEINRVPVRTAEEAASAFQSLAGRGAIRVTFERQGRYAATSFYLRG